MAQHRKKSTPGGAEGHGAKRKKLGLTRGVAEWKALDTAGDIKRFLRWIALSAREQQMPVDMGNMLCRVGEVMLKAIDTSDLEAALSRLEQRYEVLAQEHQAQAMEGFRH